MNIKSAIAEAFKSRVIIGLWILLLLESATFIVIASLSTHPSQLQVVERCSSFYSANCSRGEWFSTINFIVFGAVYFIINFFASLKILETKGRPLTLTFLCLTSAVMIMAIILMIALLNVVSIAFI
ncbi:hypothetical protein FWF74_01605 [Candidatus Saccharibacteria bacterium]|nr:hypothetical protein [Candidatus Saccharibacteria bacterium]MCL1963105.1 hypothetical protein [Candidatus Saccharibacteria bacterium]